MKDFKDFVPCVIIIFLEMDATTCSNVGFSKKLENGNNKNIT